MKMNNKKLKSGLVIFLLLSFISLEATAQDWPNIKRYAESNKKLLEDDNMKIDVVFIGNSITQGWVSNSPDFFTDNSYVGRGIGGQTTPQFLARFREDVINLKPKAVVINGGINDIAENTGPYNIDFTFGNIMSMAELAKANNIKVILTSVLPASHIPWKDSITNTPEKVIALNEKIKDYATTNNIPYVDYFSQLANPENGMIAEYTRDGVHVTGKGYAIMEKMIKDTLDDILNKKEIDIPFNLDLK